MNRWRTPYYRCSTWLYGPSRRSTPLSWIYTERIAIGTLPTVKTLKAERVTHIVNCRATAQTWLSQDLAIERALLGPSKVVHAPMWDSGGHQSPHLWSTAAHFAAEVLGTDPEARILIHCHQGRRRSVMLAYAVLRLRGHSPDGARTLITKHRTEAYIVDAYTTCVEQWLANGAKPVGLLRIR